MSNNNNNNASPTSNSDAGGSSSMLNELVHQLSRISERRIRLIGGAREAGGSSTDDQRYYLPEATVYFPPPPPSLSQQYEGDENSLSSYNVLFQAFEIIHDTANENALSRLNDALYLSFSDWDLNEIPRNLGRVMPRVNQCTFINCHNLSSLASVVEQFPNICVLVCRNCPCLTSLSSLKSIPMNSCLYNIAFKDCGLRVTANDDWNEGMSALGRTLVDHFILTFQHCPDLTCLPSSIHYLKNKELTVNFRSNGKLCKLPLELGEIRKITGLSIISCPRLHELPWSLSRLADCSLFVSDCALLLGGLSRIALGDNNRGEGNNGGNNNGIFCSIRDHQLYFVDRLKCHFVRIVFLKVFIRRWVKDVMDRMYRPEGKGYHQSKERFENMLQVIVASSSSSSSPVE